ncbi:MAG: sulfoxide reductase heme-binding subunit YedZ [Anaerolineales bacterium]|nr:sulfoxide reductase heme-binding subunit YedZ [Anaerolineales bacterium]
MPTMPPRPGKSQLLQIATHVGALLPLAWMVYAIFTDNLTVNPIQDLTFRTGKTALVLLVLSLACTPTYSLFKFRPALNMRRPLGVYAFVYIALHLTIFLFDNFFWAFGFTWENLKTTILEKRYVLVGFAAFLIFLPLAFTSTKGWQKRLGKNWKTLHKWVYLADLLVIIHYIWLVKADTTEPLAWGAGVLILLALRLPLIKKGAQTLLARLPRPGKRPTPKSPPREPASVKLTEP